MKNLSFLLLLILVLTGCKTQDYFNSKTVVSTPPKLDSTFLYNPNYEYKIRVNDKISIGIWGQEELSVGSPYTAAPAGEPYGKWLMVDAAGTIELPRIGSYQIANKTVTEVKNLIKEDVKKWLLNPVVDVKVLNKEISLLGELKTPGAIPIDKEQNNLMEMIARAGGVEPFANLKAVKIIRQNGTDVNVAVVDLTQQGDYVMKNINLIPGDVVIVPSRNEKAYSRRVALVGPILYSITTIVTLIRLLN